MSTGGRLLSRSEPVDTEVLRDVRLWLDAGVVLLLAGVWLVIDTAIGSSSTARVADYLTLGLYLAPVLYASVRLGATAGLVVALAAALVSMPWALASAHQGDALGAWANTVQVVSLLVMAFFVGRAVSAEREARQVAETARQAHLVAEARYRELFDTNVEPVLLVDEGGSVQEANAAAGRVLGNGRGELIGSSLEQLVGRRTARRLLEGRVDEPLDLHPADVPADGPGATYRPAVTETLDIGGKPMRQIVLRDVTEEAGRQRRARQYAADVLAGQEDERRRIAQELHDGPLQVLVHLVRQVDALGPGVDTSAVRRTAEGVVEDLRRISQGLRPHLLEDLGLPAALERLCEDVTHNDGVPTTLTLGELGELGGPLELTVFRIAQEALTNAARHAGASAISVLVGVEAGHLRMTVADDGVGYRAEQERNEGRSMGLVGMVERAALVGGTLEVATAPGQGVTVCLDLPVTPSPVPPLPAARNA